MTPSADIAASAPDAKRTGPPLWPAVAVTLMTSAGFAALKFILIGELALEYDPSVHMPFGWLDDLMRRCYGTGNLDEAVSQGLAAILTLGVLLGYGVNAPLAGAMRVPTLFVISSLMVASGTMLSVMFNPVLVAAGVGVAYGASCAARGKAIPLFTQQGRSATTVSGFINAALVIGLLLGTIGGTVLREHLNNGHEHQVGLRHGIIGVFMVATAALSLAVRPTEGRRTPFTEGLRQLAGGTVTMVGRHWALLVAGGLTWGVAQAASLAVYMDGIDRFKISPTLASFVGVFAIAGAILGNLASPWLQRRWAVMAGLGALSACVLLYPFIVTSWPGAAVMMVVVGTLFAAPTNVLDARFLSLAHEEGLAGRGSTVMSLVHNSFIFCVGTGLALPLLLGNMAPQQQFYALGAVAALAMVVAGFARIQPHRR
jgi:hypothetical protein